MTRVVVALFSLALLAAPLAVSPQPGKQSHSRIGWPGASPPVSPRMEMLRANMRESDDPDGQNGGGVTGAWRTGKTSPLARLLSVATAVLRAPGCSLAHGETLAALCVEPEPKDLAVPQCRHQFCYDSTRVIEVTSEGQSIWECTGWGAAATCQGNRDYQAYRLGTRDLEMYLFFDPRVVGGHDPVTIEKAFLHLWMNVYFPHRREEGVHVQTDAIRKGDPQLKRLTVEGHTVNVEIELKPVMQVLYWIESRHENCVSGDILGRCACRFKTGPIAVTVRASLKLGEAVPEARR